jgi:hypothetical protein
VDPRVENLTSELDLEVEVDRVVSEVSVFAVIFFSVLSNDLLSY